MNFREALHCIANHTRFAEEALKLEVLAAIDDALAVPEPIDAEIVDHHDATGDEN